MRPIPLSDFEKWRACNSDSFSLFDYFYSLLRERPVHADFLYATLKLIAPDFIERDGLVFLSETFSETKMRSLQAQGHEGSDLEYWMNLLPVGALFGGAYTELALPFAEEMVLTWSDRLRRLFPDAAYVVRITKDDDDIYVVAHRSK